ncbi:1-phosphofructokinase family hexose kinase [Mycobacterium colombiense]|uniref:1-phosphofructokinase family hexose kinase n=1 Tax=Mycobacterium colombiense TaxID=339268 RepID=UPI002009E436|nr:1-phosphofructokinase family hexose kinase [Mycobacterium colombiense]MCK8644203.1 1-phosphofructokinase family hexose kinase [Mycobacterium colombiense]
MDARTHSTPGRVHIVTLTLNPALDITTSVDVVRPTDKMRCQTTRYDPGGGGINVARVANVLGASVSAIFTAGGPAGARVASLVAEQGVPCQRVDIAGQTRESFTVNENSSGQQYRFVLPGPRLSSAEQSRCLDLLRAGAESADIVVASGSLPPRVPPDYYQRVADICQETNTRLVLDTSGGGLQHIASGVYLLKASVRELGERVGRLLATESEQLAAAHALVENGCAQVVLVSLGSQGALLATRRVSQRFSAISLRGGGSGVGAGDAMVGAITSGLSRGWPLVKSVRLGIAAGAAMSMTPGTEVCTRAEIEKLFALAAEPYDLPPP